MKYTLDNIDQWVAELVEKPKITQFHTYARVMRDQEQQKAKRVILDKFRWFDHGEKDVTIINDDMAIIVFDDSESKKHFVPVVRGKPQNYWFPTFEGALLGTVSILQTGDVEAAKYAGKVLEVDM